MKVWYGMKKCRIGILLLALTVALLNFTLVGCGNRNRDNESTTTTESGSPLLPSPDATLPEENGEGQTNITNETDRPNESESMTETTKQDATTTTKQETSTAQQETTTKAPESTTSKQETTTKTSESSTSDNHPILPGESVTLPLPGPNESETSDSSGSATQSESTSSTKPEDAPNVPESSAGEWIHFDAFTNDHMGAAAYLGRSAQELPVTDIINHLGLSLNEQDIIVIDNGDSEDADGDAWYLILPRYRDTVVRLHEADEENGTVTAGELIAEGMHPMLVRCDPEDGDPAVFVELIRDGETITFPLRIDKESGTAIFHDSVLNITPTRNTARRR